MSENVTSGASRRAALARRIVPFALASAVLVYLFAAIPRDHVLASLRGGPAAALFGFTVLQVLVTWISDGVTTGGALRATGIRLRTQTVVIARGASYLPGLLHYALGQGGLGWLLHRQGVAGKDAVRGMLLLAVTNILALIACAAAGLSAVRPPAWEWLLSGAALMIAIYATAVGSGALARFLGSAAPEGLATHAIGLAWRLVHVAVLVTGHWVALRVWGVPMDAEGAALVIPIVLLVFALPVTPGGLGTGQAAQVLLYAQWVPNPDPDERSAVVLAFGIVHYLSGILAQVLIGIGCTAGLRLTDSRADKERA